MTAFYEISYLVYVKVIPNAKFIRISKEVLSDGAYLFKIAVTTAPEKGKANKAVLEVLSKELKIPKSRLSIIHGHLSRDKVVRVVSNGS